MAKITDLVAKEKEREIPLPGGGTVTVVYRPQMVTFDLLDQVQGASGAGDLFKLVTEILVSWDITDAAGKALPINEKGLKQIPVEFLRDMLGAIIQGQLPGEGRGGPSGRG